jgi:hypothetical protein
MALNLLALIFQLYEKLNCWPQNVGSKVDEPYIFSVYLVINDN